MKICALLLLAVPLWAAESCEALFKMTIPNVTITAAVDTPAGPFLIPGTKITRQLPAHCRVTAVARPTSDSDIGIEVWLPRPATWNHRLEGVGNGGYTGSINYGGLAGALLRGYAAASTDTGHKGSSLTFGTGHPEKISDWGYRSVHVMTETAKLIIRSYERALPAYSYFSGCSTGGHQGLTEAQRYPADYDGIISGDPGNNRVRLNVGFLWAYAAVHETPASALSNAKLATLANAVLAACDLTDGVKDGVIGDPRHCHFDPASLLCKGDDNDRCLTAAQVKAVKKIYAGPKNPRTGAQLFAGYAYGSEHAANDEYSGWAGYLTGVAEPMRLDFWRSWVFEDPNWDWRTFDFDRDVAFADAKMAHVAAVNTNLGDFQARGGKLLMYDGWADPVGPAQDAIAYFEGVRKTMGAHKADEFVRLFMVPGMGHCAGGAGTDIYGAARSVESTVPLKLLKQDPQHDMLSAMEQWVEKGTAPQRLITSRYANGRIERTRPVCPYPQVSRWNGRGSTDDESNFTCGVSP